MKLAQIKLDLAVDDSDDLRRRKNTVEYELQSAEMQAVGRAYRQGQTQQVTIVRFLVRGTIEHQLYVKNYLEDEEEKAKASDTLHKAVALANQEKLLRSPSAKPHMFRTSSVSTLLANVPTQDPSTVVELTEQAEPTPQPDDDEEQNAGVENDIQKENEDAKMDDSN